MAEITVKMDINYAVVIRTLGLGGSKYQSLLDSIANQTIRPKYVFVFIPPEYDLPKEKCGLETFVRVEKGMMRQRALGIEHCAQFDDLDYLLVLDDDVCFDSDFAKDSLELLSKNDYDILAPTILERNEISKSPLSRMSKQNIVTTFTGVRSESRKKDFKVAILPTAGYRANSRLEGTNPTQSLYGPGFWMRNRLDNILRLNDEHWLDEVKYALPDDQIIGYKAYLNDLKQVYTDKVWLRHLDNGSSNPSRELESAYASGRNFLIFWHRFQYKLQTGFLSRMYLVLGISYRIVNTTIMSLISMLKTHKAANLKYYLKGVQAGITYIKSDQYKNLKNVITNDSKISI